ncbi:MAG: hypothetical protein GTO18_11775 [Anaerolineales bacterium]|nr:hypothetical protein [Anaerolineales bacterium]
MAVKKIAVPACHENIEDICNLAGEAAEGAGFDERTVYACQLAIGEACENVINHGYKEEGIGDLELIATSSPGRLILQLLDSAPPFNPAVTPGTPEWEDEDPPIGGLGLVIIHRVMDKVIYQRKENQNRLEMHKYVTAA